MAAYAMLGGMPSYLEQFNPNKSLRENALTTILPPNTYLSQEPDWLLLKDLRSDVICGSILHAVAKEERKPSDIARAIGKNSAQDITQQLSTLQELGLLIREVPVTERRKARSRNSLYYLADNYLDFWHRFVDGARSLVAQDMGEQVWDRTIEPAFDKYVSRPIFERACRDYLWRALRAGVLPADLNISEVGTWWGAGDREIDVVALDNQGEVCAAGSCKWTNSPMDIREYQALQKDLTLAGLDREDQFHFLFARSGFTTRLQEFASQQKPKRLFLITMEALYAV